MTSIIAMSTILRGMAPSRTRTVTSMIPSATAMCTFRTFITGTVTDCSRALAIASLAAAAYAAPYVPKDDTAVLERLPVRPGDPVARELRQLRAELTANPHKRETAVRLAERYFALATSEGDPRYVGYAQAALKPWWDLPAPPLDVLVMRAILKQYSHDFSGAMQDLEAATREDPENARAWSWRAAIHMVQADYEKAREDCLALQKLESELYAVGCVAYLDGTCQECGHSARSEGLGADAPCRDGFATGRREAGRGAFPCRVLRADQRSVSARGLRGLSARSGASRRSPPAPRRLGEIGHLASSPYPRRAGPEGAEGAQTYRGAPVPVRRRSVARRQAASAGGGALQPLSPRQQGKSAGAGAGELEVAARAARCSHPARGGARDEGPQGRTGGARLARALRP